MKDIDFKSREAIQALSIESCVSVSGTVKSRPESMINKVVFFSTSARRFSNAHVQSMPTGEIEVEVQQLEVLNSCGPLPFSVSKAENVCSLSARAWVCRLRALVILLWPFLPNILIKDCSCQSKFACVTVILISVAPQCSAIFAHALLLP